MTADSSNSHRRSSRRARWALAAGLGSLLLGLGAVDICRVAGMRAWGIERVASHQELLSTEPFQAGSARVSLAISWPRPLAGYGPWRRDVSGSALDLQAQALSLEMGTLRIGLVTLDLLLIPAPLARKISTRARAAGFEEVWVVATHTHSSVGGYDSEWLPQGVGLGWADVATERAVENAAVTALERAHAAASVATLTLAQGEAPHLSRARDGQPSADARVMRLQIFPRTGPPSQLVILAGHPTTVGRDPSLADPDYPARLAQLERPAFDVTLVVQAGGGNAMAVPPTENAASVSAPASGPDRLAAGWHAVLQSLSAAALVPDHLGFSRARASLPCPDARRLVPRMLRGLGSDVMCLGSENSIELSQVEVGPLRLLSIPGEPTFAAARRLEGAAGVARVVSLANGYLGYIELPERVMTGEGEARRQYYGPELLGQLEHAAAQTAVSPERSSNPSRAP